MMMLFRQLFERESSTYTYLIADLDSKMAILVDPVLEQIERDRICGSQKSEVRSQKYEWSEFQPKYLSHIVIQK